jgi:hypothetical protein
VLGVWGVPQRKKGKGKATAGSSGAGGGPSTKAAAAAGSSGQGSSSQGSSHPSAPPARTIGLSTDEPAVQIAEPATSAQQSEPEPEPQPAGGNTKKDKERLRKERQRHRKIEEASEALDRAMARMAETAGAGGVKAVEEAMEAAAKHDGRSEPLAALVAEAKGMLEQARSAEAERARVAAEAAAAVKAVEAVAEAAEAAERLQMEQELAALTLSVQSDARRVQSDRLRVQQIQARLGVPPAAPAPHPDAEETMCVVCFDAPKDHAIVPCGHICVCGACAEQLTKTRTPMCPVCREPIQQTMKVFCS